MEPVFQTNVISVGQRTYMIGSQFLTQRYKNRTLFVFLCDEINTIFFVGSRVILWSNSYNNENCEKKIYNLYDLCQQWISQQPENGENRNDPDLVQAFLKKWWIESDFKAPNLSLSLRLKVSGCHYDSIYNNTWTKQIKQLSNQRQTQWSKCQKHFYVTHW